MTARTRPCDRALTRGRLRKAEQFFAQAELIRELADDDSEAADAYVSLYVLAGIAAADVICCAAMSVHALGESHQEAVQLLRQVRPGGDDLARSLSALLGLKTRAGYTGEPVTAEMRRRGRRHAEKLVVAARDRAIGS